MRNRRTVGHNHVIIKWFTINLGFERMRATPQAITSAMQLYFTGESFRNVQKFLRLQGVNVSHVSVMKWIKKYVGLMRGLKHEDTPILKGIQLYHNFIRPHKSLNGQTPADKAGIRVEGADKLANLNTECLEVSER